MSSLIFFALTRSGDVSSTSPLPADLPQPQDAYHGYPAPCANYEESTSFTNLPRRKGNDVHLGEVNDICNVATESCNNSVTCGDINSQCEDSIFFAMNQEHFENTKSCKLLDLDTGAADQNISEGIQEKDEMDTFLPGTFDFCDSELLSDIVTDYIQVFESQNSEGRDKESSTSAEKCLLYKNSQVTLEESMLLISSFVLRHKLSNVATEDLLHLVSLHCPQDNSCTKDMKDFCKFFQSLNNPMRKHFYCPSSACKAYIGTDIPPNGKTCNMCMGELSQETFFLELPIEEQLKGVLSSR